MPRGNILPRPVLKFRGGTALTPKEGLSLFHPLRGPKKILLGVGYPEGRRDKASKLVENIIYGVKGFISMDIMLDTNIEVVESEGRDPLDAAREIASYKPDVALIFVPDEAIAGEDFYIPAKQELADSGIPSQMVTYSTMKYRAEDPYTLFNLAIDIYGKAGGVAWGLAEDLSTEVVIGFDVAGGVLTTNLFLNPGNPMLEWEIFPNIEVEVAPALSDALRWAIRRAYKLLGREIRSLQLHRDGRYHWSEVEATREALSEAKEIGLVDGDLSYTMLEVRKKVVPRIIRVARSKLTNPEKGLYVEIEEETYLLSTTGWPERRTSMGVVKPIIVHRIDTSNWDEDALKYVRDIYWLSSLHWGSMFVTPRLPISTLYPHRICGFTRQGVFPPEEYRGKLWFL